jgi:hypothetical protein
MMGTVEELSALVGGSRNGTGMQQTLSGEREHKVEAKKALPAFAEKAKAIAVRKTKPEISQGTEVAPDQVIPLDDKDFKDF